MSPTCRRGRCAVGQPGLEVSAGKAQRRYFTDFSNEKRIDRQQCQQSEQVRILESKILPGHDFATSGMRGAAVFAWAVRNSALLASACSNNLTASGTVLTEAVPGANFIWSLRRKKSHTSLDSRSPGSVLALSALQNSAVVISSRGKSNTSAK